MEGPASSLLVEQDTNVVVQRDTKASTVQVTTHQHANGILNSEEGECGMGVGVGRRKRACGSTIFLGKLPFNPKSLDCTTCTNHLIQPAREIVPSFRISENNLTLIQPPENRSIREVKHDVYCKRQTAKMKLSPSLFSCVFSRVKSFVTAMTSRRRYSIFVYFIYGLEGKNSKSEVVFAVCRLPLTSCLTSG